MTDSVADAEKGLNGFRNAKVRGSIPRRSTTNPSSDVQTSLSPSTTERQSISKSMGCRSALSMSS